MLQYLSTQGSARKYRGVEQLVARRAHNPEVVGSSPASATRSSSRNGFCYDYFFALVSFIRLAYLLFLADSI